MALFRESINDISASIVRIPNNIGSVAGGLSPTIFISQTLLQSKHQNMYTELCCRALLRFLEATNTCQILHL